MDGRSDRGGQGAPRIVKKTPAAHLDFGAAGGLLVARRRRITPAASSNQL
jgi:hypothetical protein